MRAMCRPRRIRIRKHKTMTRTYFGTDGIRGQANSEPMTAEVALKVGMAAGLQFKNGGHRHQVVIAKDTRLSGYLLEPALTAGFISVGMDVLLLGPLPTPAVAMLTRSMRADLGVMISASHNPYEDNGIKLFGPDGGKLSDEVEQEIEARIKQDISAGRVAPDKLGRARRIDDARGRYIEFVKQSFPRQLRLDGLTIVMDCANGAAYHIGPVVLRELGAKVVALGVEPDGFNINRDCGSTRPEAMCAKVREVGADLGIALDGDADRVLICDEHGEMIDGDQMLALLAVHWQETGQLRGAGIVATQMSNLALEQYLQAKGIALHRAAVGDRYVLEGMREQGCNLGGEQSGHIIMRDYTTTGDGLIAALQVLAVMLTRGEKLSICGRPFTPMPQILKNVLLTGSDPLAEQKVQAAIAAAQARLNGSGRVYVRKSGTEPRVRVMVEGESRDAIEQEAEQLCKIIEAA